MTPESMVVFLCLVGFFLLLWALLLRIQVQELDKKLKALEGYFTTRKKIDEV